MHPLLARRVVDQPVLPFAGIAVIADRRVERGITAKSPVHLDDIPLGDADTLCNQLDLVGAQIPFLEGGNLVLRIAQV